MGRGQMNNRLALECKFGKLVCEVVRDDDEYKELAIDLYRNDGKAVQVAVIGTDEYELWKPERLSYTEKKQHDMVHIFYYDGESVDCCGQHFVEPFGNGWWGEEEA